MLPSDSRWAVLYPMRYVILFEITRQVFIMLYMTYRIYLRWPDSKTTEKTATEDPAVAALAFGRLLSREDLKGQAVAVACTRDGQQIDYFDFAETSDYCARGMSLPNADDEIFFASLARVLTNNSMCQ